MPEPALLHTWDKSITVNGNKAYIGNDSLTIIDRRSYHMVGGLGYFLRVRVLRSCSRVQGPRSCSKVRDLSYCLRVLGPRSCPKNQDMRSCFSVMPQKTTNESCVTLFLTNIIPNKACFEVQQGTSKDIVLTKRPWNFQKTSSIETVISHYHEPILWFFCSYFQSLQTTNMQYKNYSTLMDFSTPLSQIF